MTVTPKADDLIQLQSSPRAENGAPAGEPETWDPTVPAFNPLFSHTPEPEPLNVSPPFAAAIADPDFEIEAFLDEERGKDLLRFSTAGSVDDGKSTLIGRLLYDTQAVYEDQLRSIEGKGSAGAGVLDLALLTDGLRAEREQGITIDVAYRYFSTARRKFIIADTPGHEQYTRNMATGASTADLAIVLVDARKGVLPQSRRHAYITALLGVRHVVVAVNKMDLIGFDEGSFRRIAEDFTTFFREIRFAGECATTDTSVHIVPVSALAGDNVARASEQMPWYTGPTLLELLETTPIASLTADADLRFAVQRVVRPDQNFRGFAGQLAAGTVRVGDSILALPSRRSSRVRRIVTFDGDLREASAPLSVTLTLDDELDISRGDLLVAPDAPAILAHRITASLVWMDEQPLETGRRYLLKHTTRVVQARVSRVLDAIDVDTMQHRSATGLALNGIGLVELETTQPLAADPYAANRVTGSFILIDPITNATAAAGMIRALADSRQDAATGEEAALSTRVTPDERAARWGQHGVRLHVHGPQPLANAIERALFNRGHIVVQLGTGPGGLGPQAADQLAAIGLVVMTQQEGEGDAFRIQSGAREIRGQLTGSEPLTAALSRALKLFDEANVNPEIV